MVKQALVPVHQLQTLSLSAPETPGLKIEERLTLIQRGRDKLSRERGVLVLLMVMAPLEKNSQRRHAAELEESYVHPSVRAFAHAHPPSAPTFGDDLQVSTHSREDLTAHTRSNNNAFAPWASSYR